MSIALEQTDRPADDDFLRYRALSPMAVVSLVLGVGSVVAWLSPLFAIVPILGVLSGLYAWRRISYSPDDLSGLKLAKLGVTLSLILGISGGAQLSYVYATEVPEGYERVSYAALQPDPRVPNQMVPNSARDLDGRKIFIKGYVYPGEFVRDGKGIRKFVLCRDNGQCCFGGQPKTTDMILVSLVDPLRLEYSTGVVRLAGRFKVEPASGGQLGGIVYQLTADHLK